MDEPRRVGPFDLLTRVARGGMGQVWRGVHRRSGEPVAVKEMLGRVEPRTVASFRNEVRAMAGLDHPHVARVLDYGTLDDGAPYLAMEWVDCSGLLPSVRDWRGLRRALVMLLDALAHAHARGLVHRDLKPANVLCDPRGALKLTDFGLAHALHSTDDNERLAGTPAYMSPEQCHGRWRDFGPWTDLYALGCLAYELAQGAPPFTGPSELAILNAHVRRAVPALAPRFPVPDGFMGWLERLLQKDPARRYQRAADAAAVLAGLPVAMEGDASDVVEALCAPTLSWSFRDTAAGVPALSVDASDYDVERPMAGGLARPADVVGAGEWRRERSVARVTLVDAGLSLFGLRRAPFVDRDSAREAAWSALRSVATVGRPRALVLRGASGTGKSRLAEWLSERAHELGMAVPLQATHSPLGGPADGLGPMLRRHVRGERLEPVLLRQRLSRLLAGCGGDDYEEAQALVELMVGDDHERSTGTAEQHVALGRLLARLGRARPTLVWIDDAQWGLDALQFARRLLDRDQTPVLLVLTARDDLLGRRPFEARLLSAIMRLEAARTIELGPLSEVDHRALLDGLLPLDPALAGAVAERTAGNPLFAVQLVRDWAERELLVSGPDGFALVEGAADLPLPGDVDDFWRERVDHFLQGRGDDDGRALELAAALGRDVDGAEWTAACALAGIEVAPGLRDELLRQRLARPRRHAADGRGWTFAHNMLRESLEARAGDAGWHRVCAQVVGTPGRVGRHLLAAGDAEQALAPLAEGAQAHLERGAYAEAESDLQTWAEALARSGVVDERAADGPLLSALLHRARGHLPEARAAATEALRLATDAERRARALLTMGRLHPDEALARYEAADALARTLDDRGLQAECDRHLAVTLASTGQCDDALLRIRHAQLGFEAAGRPLAAADALRGEAAILKQLGHFEPAGICIAGAAARFRAEGARVGEADCLHDLAELQRLSGDLDEADDAYRRAGELYEALGSGSLLYVHCNRALLLLERGDHAAVATLVDRHLPRLDTTAVDLLRIGARIVRAAAAAALDDWPTFDLLFDESVRLIDETGTVELDIARTAEHAAQLCESMAQPARADLCRDLATRQRAALR